MRALLFSAAAAAALLLGAQPGHAYGNGPWCAWVNTGMGNVVEDCRYASLEACRQTVISGNRGFCNPNQYVTGARPYPRRHHRRHAHRQ